MSWFSFFEPELAQNEVSENIYENRAELAEAAILVPLQKLPIHFQATSKLDFKKIAASKKLEVSKIKFSCPKIFRNFKNSYSSDFF